MKKKLVYMLLSATLLASYGGPMLAHGTETIDSSSLIQKTDEEIKPQVESETPNEGTEDSKSEEVEKESSNQEDQTKESQTEASETEETDKAEEKPVEAGLELFSATAVQRGTYNIYSAGNSAAMMSVVGGSKSNSAQMELNKQMYHGRSQFELIPVDGTWFVIKNVNSGLVLDVQNGSKANRVPIQQYKQNNSDAQKWQLVDAGSGYYYIQSKLGTVLDCTDGNTGIGTKLQTFALNRTNAQKWRLDGNVDPALKEVTAGTYQITGSGTDKVLSLNGMTSTNREKVLLYSSSYSGANEFVVEKTSDNWYYIVNRHSKKVLDIADGNAGNGAQIQQFDKNGSDAQKFRFIDAGGGYVYIQSKLGTVLDRANGASAEGTKIQTYALNHTAAQKWLFEAPKAPKTVAVQNGVRYFISSNINTNRVLEVSNGSTAERGNVQLWSENAAKQQKFIVEAAGDGWYKLVNEKSGKVLDVANASTANKANVQQFTWNNSDAQKFRFIDAGSGLTYIQSKLGSYLDVDNGQNKEGANIQMYRFNRTNSQKFRLDALNKTNYIRTTILSSTTARVTVFNSSVNASSMKFPTWSETKGQDDIKWLNGSKSYDGSWTVVVNSVDFRDGGKFNTHVYANGTAGLGTTSYTLQKNRTALQQSAYNVLNQVGWDLKKAFDWTRNTIGYQDSSYPAANAGAAFANEHASKGFNQRKGNCYTYASTFYYLAKELGYDAHVVVGSVVQRNGSLGPHGWVEIDINGATYVFDAELGRPAYGNKYPYYYITYNTAGAVQYRNYRRIN
ncbi:RICIN domain-containing protein [Enterococcus sp. BWR-S5]|uniref:RICIN domain-containing protein n=1 Tax=Enterococcus sp. BWR-S5 TaxID=2787714 RepID=UPI0019237F5A|nr:RICIN domain-containing protein [Enterococcus sp. BWR-S5]